MVASLPGVVASCSVSHLFLRPLPKLCHHIDWDHDGYLAMADDPYDLENPYSLQNTLTFTAKCEGSAALKDMLESALSEQMAAEGYGGGEWRLDSIRSILPVNPRFEGSRMYQGLRFDLRVRLLQTVEPSAPPAAARQFGEQIEAPGDEGLLLRARPPVQSPLDRPRFADRLTFSVEDQFDGHALRRVRRALAREMLVHPVLDVACAPDVVAVVAAAEDVHVGHHQSLAVPGRAGQGYQRFCGWRRRRVS